MRAEKKLKRYVVAVVKAPNSNWARVVFGELVAQKEKLVVLAKARQALYYDSKTGGELGLAATGPAGNCRITGTVGRVELSGFEGLLMDCDEAAIAAWKEASVYRG
jgi:hypothetical protein